MTSRCRCVYANQLTLPYLTGFNLCDDFTCIASLMSQPMTSLIDTHVRSNDSLLCFWKSDKEVDKLLGINTEDHKLSFLNLDSTHCYQLSTCYYCWTNQGFTLNTPSLSLLLLLLNVAHHDFMPFQILVGWPTETSHSYNHVHLPLFSCLHFFLCLFSLLTLEYKADDNDQWAHCLSPYISCCYQDVGHFLVLLQFLLWWHLSVLLSSSSCDIIFVLFCFIPSCYCKHWQADANLGMEQRHFVQASLEYILKLQEVHERKKFEFVETVCIFLGNVSRDC